MKKYFYYLKIIFGIFFLSLYLSGCKKSEINTVSPRIGAIQQTFTELAKTRLSKTYDIDMPISGNLERITLEPGDKVLKDQVVAQLTLYPLQQNLKKTAASLETMKAYYAYKRNELNRQQKLVKKGFVSKSDYDNALAEAEVMAAQIKETAAALRIAEYNLKMATLTSPINGIVLNRYSEGGTWLRDGTKLLKIGNFNELEVVSEVLTQQASRLKVGEIVILTSFDDLTSIYGRIKRIDPAGFTKKSALGVDEQRVNVVMSLYNPEKVNLGDGYRLQATFKVGQGKKQALIVPRFSVLQDPQGNFYVFKVADNKLYKQIVVPGIKTDQLIEIQKGLTIKDLIVSQPTAEMNN
ncbi:MAG: efflux RND transporter periplasmic adaptor subunit [Gammaproteobacteria bacterium]|nr:efflux RND transporter periplasmic adaptor subunit [Gammaproteobacteria bacterium]